MRTYINNYSLSFLILLLLSMSSNMLAQLELTFQLDMNGVEIGKEDLIGVRGAVTPLSWTETLPMTDPDNDGIYSVSVIFNKSNIGDRIMYKYTWNENWDLDRYQEFGNRVLTLANCSQINPIDSWDQIGKFSEEMMLRNAIINNFNLWVYVIADAKQRGKTAEEAVMQYNNFWGDDYSWIEDVQIILTMEEFNQAMQLDGYIEVIENSDEKLIMKLKRIGAYMINSSTNSDYFMGVTAEDMDEVSKSWFKSVALEKGWVFKWEDIGDFAIVSFVF